MNTLPSISIITTVFNKEAYIKDTIQSVCNSLTENVLEYIIIDDCSTDNSWHIISNAASKYEFIKAVRNPINLGDYSNRSKGVRISTGEYIKFIDADDLLYPHSLRVFNEALKTHPKCALYLSWNKINPPFPYPRKISPSECFRQEFLHPDSYLGVGPSAALIQRIAYDTVGGFTSERHVGDLHLWRSIAVKHEICLLPPSLCFWRIHPEQESAIEKANSKVQITRLSSDLRWLNRSAHFFSKREFKRRQLRLKLLLIKISVSQKWKKIRPW